MKPKTILTILLCLFVSIAYGNDPAQIFMSELLQSRGANVWFVGDDTVPNPKGGYLYRFELDIDGDGQKEVFLATSLDVDRKGATWDVFRKNGSGDYQKIKDSFYIGSGLRIKTESGVKKYSFYVPLKAAEGGSYFGYFWLQADGNWHDETHDLTESEQAMKSGEDSTVLNANGLPDDDKIAQKLNLGSRVSIVTQKVLLAKYFQNSSTLWRNVNTEFTLSQQYLDPADAADIASLTNWTPPSNP